jgi:hypothetical protein
MFNLITIVGGIPMVEILRVLFAGVVIPVLMQVLNQLAKIWTQSLTKDTRYVIRLGEGVYSFAN